ncbi:hypothetical protein BDV26DRAFT_298934 [Aspergillus bertholletiae]|uniref:Uncharacterized protein n=1 Tax=Aspergillus bertholletiae TaxID=1226010 RepID=A0A5N7AN72_9EURO|nr:hypothetical protein BDV26DRAFT_298934 [Aspergillus bertholletiae]
MIFKKGVYVLVAARFTANAINIDGDPTTTGSIAAEIRVLDVQNPFTSGETSSPITLVVELLCLTAYVVRQLEDSDEVRPDEVRDKPCTSTAIPTIFAWEGEGVWVLEPREGEAWDRCNELPPTTDYDVHLKNLKAFGATWYENARDHPGAAEMLHYV